MEYEAPLRQMLHQVPILRVRQYQCTASDHESWKCDVERPSCCFTHLPRHPQAHAPEFSSPLPCSSWLEHSTQCLQAGENRAPSLEFTLPPSQLPFAFCTGARCSNLISGCEFHVSCDSTDVDQYLFLQKFHMVKRCDHEEQ